jgi:PIN domain nuclease of toxin-antitoxin system
MRAREKEIPKDGGKVRVLSIPAIRDRVVQGAVKLILEPIFADVHVSVVSVWGIPIKYQCGKISSDVPV